MNLRHILIAEDDPRDETLILSALEEYHLANTVFVVRDGEEVLDYLYRHGKFKDRMAGDPAAVLLDLKMPKVTGIEVLKIIKGDEHLKSIPIIVLTSSREEPELTECYKLGVNAYVVKPVDFTEFMKAIKLLGVFWVVVNEAPPQMRKGDTTMLTKAIASEKKGIKNEISNPHPALGG